MVVSKLDKSISYPEIKSIMADDKELTVELYSIEVKEKDIVIAIGNPNYTYSSKNVVYYPIYMIKKSGKAVQVGIYEILAVLPDSRSQSSTTSFELQKRSPSNGTVLFLY